MNEYITEKGKIKSQNGIPHLNRWFCDDLLVMEKDKHGISKVEYYNQTTKGLAKVFVDDMWGGFAFYLHKKNGYRYTENITECTVMPYGFEGIWEHNGVKMKYSQRIINNTICVKLKTGGSVPADMTFDLEFYDFFSFTPFDRGDFRFADSTERKWTPWEFKDNLMTTSYVEPKNNAGTYVCLGGNFEINYSQKPLNPKHILTSPILMPNTEYTFFFAFDNSGESAQKRFFDTMKNEKAYIEKQDKRYKDIMEKAPVLESPYEGLNRFFELAPLYHESCKVTSVPGAVRAKTNCYWVWGWDGMSSSFAYSYWDDMNFLKDLLSMYMETADKKMGIAHCYARDMSHVETSPYAAQGFYISILYQYYINGGDISPYYAFAKKIFNMIADHEVGDTGLCEGFSLFPDFRETILENGNDISAFNNSSLYCAVAAMTKLAEAAKDEATAKRASELSKRTLMNFQKILFNEEAGFFNSSADSKTLERRNCFTSMSIKWDNQFCYDIVKGKTAQSLKFFEDNFLCKAGISPMPVWVQSYDSDANQAHCNWPCNDEYYARLMNFEDRKDLIDKYVQRISYWTNMLTCPEGINCYIDTETPETDFWTTENGVWQSYSMRAWYEATVHSIVGIDTDFDGINIYPYSGEEMTLKNLHYCGKTIDVYMKGSGKKIKSVKLNGKDLGTVSHVSKSLLNAQNKLEVLRG